MAHSDRDRDRDRDKRYTDKRDGKLGEEMRALVPNVRNNMKAKAISLWDRAILWRHFSMTSINDPLKKRSQIARFKHQRVHDVMLHSAM
ncbi:MAG: transposase [Shewanella sp.]